MNDPFDKVINYIKQHLDQGIPEEAIRQTLLQHNWSADVIDQAFSVAKPPTAYLPTIPTRPPSAYDTTSAQNWQQNDTEQDHTPNQTNYLQTNSQAPSKYNVFRAIGDALSAIRNNAVTYSLSVIISYIAAAVILGIVFLVIGILLPSESGMLTSASNMLPRLFVSMVVYTIFYPASSGIVLAITSLALYAGSQGRKNSLANVFSMSFTIIGRVILAELLFIVVVFWLPALMVILPAIHMISSTISGATASISSLVLLLIATLVAIVWAYITLVRFALVPFVALFEPNVPITKTLGRSKHLLMKGGQWFLVKGFLLLAAITIVLNILTPENSSAGADVMNVVGSVIIIIVSILANGVLVMLYLNRKAVRG